MEADANTTPSPDRAGDLEDRVARLETRIDALAAKLDMQTPASAQERDGRPVRDWRERATKTFGAADEALKGRPVLTVVGLTVSAIVLIQLLD